MTDLSLIEKLQEAYDDPAGDIMWRAGLARAMGIIRQHNSSMVASKPDNPVPLVRQKAGDATSTQELLIQAWELSTWAGSINWCGGENQKEWLDELREKIERFQTHYKIEGKNDQKT